MLHIKPKEGLVVRDPKSKIQLPAEGQKVVSTNYWIRRLKAGDVVLVEQTEKQKETKIISEE